MEGSTAGRLLRSSDRERNEGQISSPVLLSGIAKVFKSSSGSGHRTSRFESPVNLESHTFHGILLSFVIMVSHLTPEIEMERAIAAMDRRAHFRSNRPVRGVAPRRM